MQPIEPKRDEFRKYLERSGTIEALTKLFVKLFQENERPENPMEFIRENFGDSVLCQQVIKDLKLELNDLKNENKALKDILQKNGIEAPENDASAEESIFQSQTAISAVEMQESINKENLKRNAQKHAGSVDQTEQPVQEAAISSDSQAAVAAPAGNKESEAEVEEGPQVVASETVQEKSLSSEASAEEQNSKEADKNSADVPKEEPANN